MVCVRLLCDRRIVAMAKPRTAQNICAVFISSRVIYALRGQKCVSRFFFVFALAIKFDFETKILNDKRSGIENKLWYVCCCAVWQSWKISILAHNRNMEFHLTYDSQFIVAFQLCARDHTEHACMHKTTLAYSTRWQNIHNIKFRIAFQASEILRFFQSPNISTSQHLTLSLLLPLYAVVVLSSLSSYFHR